MDLEQTKKSVYSLILTGNTSQAFDICKTALTYCYDNFGKEHIDTAFFLDAMGMLFCKKGMIPDADKCFFSSYRIYRDQLGSGHPTTIKCKMNKINVLILSKKLKEAEKQLKEIIFINNKSHGHMSHANVEPQILLGTIYAEYKQFDNAIKEFSVALKICEYYKATSFGMQTLYLDQTIAKIYLCLANSSKKSVIDTKKYADIAERIMRSAKVIDYSIIADSALLKIKAIIKEGDNKAALELVINRLEELSYKLKPSNPSMVHLFHIKGVLERR